MPMSFDVERYVRCGASARTRCGATATVFPRAIDKSTNRPSRTLYVTATKSATRSRPTAVEVVGCKSSAAKGSLRGVTGVPCISTRPFEDAPRCYPGNETMVISSGGVVDPGLHHCCGSVALAPQTL